MIRLFYKICLSFLLCFMVWLAGLGWFVMQIPTEAAEDVLKADAIVVLTGGSERIEYALKLLAKNPGKALFISGVSEGVTAKDIVRMTSPGLQQALGTPLPSSIYLGHEAVNTIGNAEETAQWIKFHDFKSLRLVTSNYHMPRAISEFRELLPGVAIIAAPVFPPDFPRKGWWRELASRRLVLSEFHKYLAGKLRHAIIFATREAS